MENILKRLDKAFSSNPEPDAVALYINMGGWIKGIDFTDKLYQEWRDKRVAVCHMSRHRKGNYMHLDGDYYKMNWGLDYVNNQVGKHYFILIENFTGDLPDVCSNDEDYS